MPVFSTIIGFSRVPEVGVVGLVTRLAINSKRFHSYCLEYCFLMSQPPYLFEPAKVRKICDICKFFTVFSTLAATKSACIATSNGTFSSSMG